jgi:acyl-CoA thioesterase II
VPPATAKCVKSVQAAFPREARPDSPVHLDLETIHEGRSVGLRRATIWQDRDGARCVCATASILLDAPDEGMDCQPYSPGPGDPAQASPADFSVVPGESRLASETGLDDERELPAELSFWIRCPGVASDARSRSLVAYVTDWPVIGTLLKSVPGTSERDAHVTLQTAVLTHSLWFHQPLDASKWIRLEITGHRLFGGRGFGTGWVYTEAGTLVASFAQESVIRRPRVPALPGTRTATGEQQ